MKPHVADYATRTLCVRIEPANDAPVVRMTDYPVDLPMSNGEVYGVLHGYEFSGLDATADLSAPSLDLGGILQQGAISRDDLLAGVYDNARVYVFATSFATPIEDEEPCGLYFFGKVDCTDERYKTELMGAIDVLSQQPGRTYSPSCKWTLFDQTLDGRVIAWFQSRCTGPRSSPDGPALASFKVTGTLTSVTDQTYFADSARTEANDYFGEGSIRFTSGANAGLAPIQIKAYVAAGGVIQLHEAAFYLPQVGDAYEMIPGCRKRPEDCVAWANKRNFGGHDHVPSPSQYSQVGRK